MKQYEGIEIFNDDIEGLFTSKVCGLVIAKIEDLDIKDPEEILSMISDQFIQEIKDNYPKANAVINTHFQLYHNMLIVNGNAVQLSQSDLNH